MTAENAPEVAGGLLSGQDRERYLRLVEALRHRDETAAGWLVNTGVFLRDGRPGDEALQLLSLAVQGKGDPLWYLTHVRTMRSVSGQDLAYFQSIVPAPADTWYFNDDIRGLEAFDLLSKDAGRSLQRIFEKARHDPEVRLGLYLINVLGLPDSRAFTYPVPAYNVQLYVLARLLEQGVPGDYERAAVAAALTYGSLMTLCDAEAREQVLHYAGERVRFLINTDVLLAAAGAGWRATDYPLEALMVLLWSGQATSYPEPPHPLARARDLRSVAAERPLQRSDLDRLLVAPALLQEMQEEMLTAIIERTSDEVRAAELVEEWWSTHRREEPDGGGPDLNRQWARFREGKGFAGGVESAYVLQGLAASINLPLPWAQLWYAQEGELRVVPYGLRLDPAGRALRLGSSAARAVAGLDAEARAALVIWRFPWDNWHLHDGVRTIQTLPLPLSVWRAGIPSGYLLRQGVAAEEEILEAMGVRGR
jgi:hypothetical protein